MSRTCPQAARVNVFEHADCGAVSYLNGYMEIHKLLGQRIQFIQPIQFWKLKPKTFGTSGL